MTRTQLIVGLALALSGIAYWTSHSGGRPHSVYQPLIERLLGEYLNDQHEICIPAGPFPFNPLEKPRYFTEPPDKDARWVWKDELAGWAPGSYNLESFDAHCERCEDLLQAGVLEKTEQQSELNGNTRIVPTYNLSPLGLQLYRADIRQKPMRVPMPGICLADKLVLHKFNEFQPMQKFGLDRMVGFKYTLEAVKPHPFLFDPANAPLKLPKPVQQRPALLPPAISTVRIFPGEKDGELDSSLRYGKYVNQ